MTPERCDHGVPCDEVCWECIAGKLAIERDEHRREIEELMVRQAQLLGEIERSRVARMVMRAHAVRVLRNLDRLVAVDETQG